MMTRHGRSLEQTHCRRIHGRCTTSSKTLHNTDNSRKRTRLRAYNQSLPTGQSQGQKSKVIKYIFTYLGQSQGKTPCSVFLAYLGQGQGQMSRSLSTFGDRPIVKTGPKYNRSRPKS